MLEKTKRATVESGTLFIFWGILIILAIAGTYLLAYFHKFHWIWINWIFFAVIGWAYSIFYGIRREKKHQTKTYVQSAVKYLSIACGLGYLLVGFVLPGLGVYSHSVIPILVAVISGILLFVLGGIYEWNILKWCGLLWWLGAVGIIFVPKDYNGLFLVPLIIFGYLVPGFIYRAKYKKEKSLQ